MTLELRTGRLQILPLDLHQLRMQQLGPQELAMALGLAPKPGQITDPELSSALPQMIGTLETQPQCWPWSTNWVIILSEEGLVIGGCCFHGPANDKGEVEVGYGLDPAFRGRGYMTEALQALIAWAASQPNIVAIIAETEKDNLPSQRVLLRLGMHLDRETDTGLWWRLEKGSITLCKESSDGSA